MRKLLTTITLLCVGVLSHHTIVSACSDLIVGKKASKDGSVIISYAADSHTLYGELYFWPSANWANGAMRQVIDWDSGKPLGYIPQVGHTYNVVGNMNENQVAITESTFGGREECVNPNGKIDYGSLIYIALQRSRSAKEAIKVMTSLAEKYGYCSEGESFTVADKNEVWILEMVGKGPKNPGAVWVAIRIPDNAISAHANQSRIHHILFNDPQNCMYAKDVVEVARQFGWFKGKDTDFDFQAAYNPYSFVGLRACEARVWNFFQAYNKDMGKYLKFIEGDKTATGPLPLYVIPDRKLSVADVEQAMRSHFEGTPLDMTKDPGAGMYKCPYRWRPMTWKLNGKTYINERAISTQQTGFVYVVQLRDWLPDAIGGVLWFGVDDANMTVFTPIYGCITYVPECYRVGNGDMMHFSWTSAFWIHNWVANMAYNRYEPMIKDIRPVQQRLENFYFEYQPTIEKKALDLYKKDPRKAAALLTEYCSDVANQATQRWKRLGEFLLVKYMDGNEKKMKDGHFLSNGYGQSATPNFPGYNKKYYEDIVNATGDKFLIKEHSIEHK